MITSMSMQTLLYVFAVMLGMLCGLAYDFIRLIRRIIKHNAAAVHIEDALFWFAASAAFFLFYYRLNYADIRTFIFIGFFGGMILYCAVISRLLQTAAKNVFVFLKGFQK